MPLNFNVCGNRAPSPRSELCSSLKRHASFVFLHGHDGMRLGGGAHSDEEMWHNKLKQRLDFWHQAKNSSHKPKEKRKRGVGEDFFWYANVSIMWDFGALDSGCCGRVWRNGDIYSESWIKIFSKTFAFLWITVGFLKPRHQLLTLKQCDTLCFINKTSETHARVHGGAILGCETHSINSCSEMETLSEFDGQNGKTRQFSSQKYCIVLNDCMLSHKVRARDDANNRWITPWNQGWRKHVMLY